MVVDLVNIVAEIDSLIRKHAWFDFHVVNYDGANLVVAGSDDLTYYHTLEVIFQEVFFVSGYFQGWHSETNQRVFLLPENTAELNQRFNIEQGNTLFIFRTEDMDQDVVIAAKGLTYNTDTVYYYHRPNLKENERIAGFVKRR